MTGRAEERSAEGTGTMRHVVSIAFDFDDDTIRHYIEEQAVDDVRNQLIADARRQVPRNDCDWQALVERCIRDYLDEHVDEIVSTAALVLAMRTSRRKPWRECLAEATAELADGGTDETSATDATGDEGGE